MHDLSYCLTKVKALRERGPHLVGFEMNSTRRLPPVSAHGVQVSLLWCIWKAPKYETFFCISKVARDFDRGCVHGGMFPCVCGIWKEDFNLRIIVSVSTASNLPSSTGVRALYKRAQIKICNNTQALDFMKRTNKISETKKDMYCQNTCIRLLCLLFSFSFSFWFWMIHYSRKSDGPRRVGKNKILPQPTAWSV